MSQLHEEVLYDHPIGTNFRGVCTKCKEKDDVKYLRDMKWGKTRKIGPYNRLCAYELKYEKIPPYNRMPESRFELVYRILTKKEFPENGLLNFYARSMFIFTMFVLSLLLHRYLIIQYTDTYLLIYILFIFLLALLIIALEIGPDAGIYQSFKKRVTVFFNDNLLLTYELWYERLSIPNLLLTTPLLVIFAAILLPIILTLIAFFLLMFLLLVSVFGIIFLLIFSIWIYLLPLYLLMIIFNTKSTVKGIRNYSSRFFRILSGVFGSDEIGKNHLEHFELFWNGKIYLSDKNKFEYRYTFLITGGTIYWIFTGLIDKIHLNDIIDYFFDDFPQTIYYESALNYFGLDFMEFIQTLLAIFIIFLSYQVSTDTAGLITKRKYYNTPSDIHKAILLRHMRILEKKVMDEELEKSKKSRFKLGNPIKMLTSRDYEFECPICKSYVNEKDNLIQCKECFRIFHKNHILSYFDSSTDKNCPVCRMDQSISFPKLI